MPGMQADHYGAVYAPRYEEHDVKTTLETAAPYVAEFLGTFFFVFTVKVCCVAGDSTWNPTAIGCMLTVLVYTFSSVNVDGPAGESGHLNPAVSFATGLAKKEPWKKVWTLIALQLLASQLASGICFEIFPDSKSTAVGPHKGFEHTYFFEIVYTAVLCFVVLNVGYSTKNNPQDDQNHFFALAIGLVVVAAGYAGGGISGACLNPAVAFGLDYPFWLLSPSPWTFMYVGLQLLGGLVGASLFLICRRQEPQLLVNLVSEFLGTFVLVLTVGLCVVMQSVATAWAAAAALACMIYALGDVSGAHFNPAVTFAVVLSRRGKCSPFKGVLYMVVQVLAGYLASFIIADVHVKGPYSSQSFCLKPSEQGNWTPVSTVEFIFTFMLAYVVLAVATTEQLLIKIDANQMNFLPRFAASRESGQNFPFAFAIGSCVTAGGFAGGTLNGGYLNPAVAMGIANSCALAPGDLPASPWSHWANFATFQMAGGMLAAVVFAVTHHHEFTKKQEV